MFLSLCVIFFHTILVTSGQSSNFSCNSGNLCRSQTYSCLQNADCYIDCNGGTVCQGSTFNCPDNYNCYIKGRGGNDAMGGTTINGGNNGNLIHECGEDGVTYACFQQNIWCLVNGVCNVTSKGQSSYWSANIRGDNATQLNAYSSTTQRYGIANSKIYCPTSDSAECNIKVEGGSNYMLYHTDIYSVKSFIGVSITCIYQTNIIDECFTSGERPKMYCTGNYSEMCEMELDSGYNNWSCTNTSVCDSFTAQPTTNEPSITPTTVVPTETPTTGIPTKVPITSLPSEIPTTNNPTDTPATAQPITNNTTTHSPTVIPTTVAPTTRVPITNHPTSYLNNPTTYSPTSNTGTSIPPDNPETTTLLDDAETNIQNNDTLSNIAFIAIGAGSSFIIICAIGLLYKWWTNKKVQNEIAAKKIIIAVGESQVNNNELKDEDNDIVGYIDLKRDQKDIKDKYLTKMENDDYEKHGNKIFLDEGNDNKSVHVIIQQEGNINEPNNSNTTTKDENDSYSADSIEKNTATVKSTESRNSFPTLDNINCNINTKNDQNGMMRVHDDNDFGQVVDTNNGEKYMIAK